jgi:hypothetical protein
MHQAWVVAADMGYGHQRAAYPLRGIAYERIITANSEKVADSRELARWDRIQGFYEGMSRLSGVPGIGPYLWAAYDQLQRIASLYPARDLSHATLAVRYLDRLIERGLARGVVEYTSTKPLPFVSTYFIPPLAAARAGLHPVFCIVTDVDIHRIWVGPRPAESRTFYFAPSEIGRLRLLQYGVPPSKVFLTGFPLPVDNVTAAEADLRGRLARLDPERRFLGRYGRMVTATIGEPQSAEKTITITYAVGGAGAQKDIAGDIIRSLGDGVRDGRFRVNLVAGTRLGVRSYFLEAIERAGLSDQLDHGIRVVAALDKRAYFEAFNRCLRDTDVLWTKPSELVFYTALGLPILMTRPLGSHEAANRQWLRRMGAGFTQEDPRACAEWLQHWIDQGMLAEAAFDGYMKAPREGTANIKRLVFAADPGRVAWAGGSPGSM